MELIVYDTACRAIAEATRVDEVKGWHDKAAAIEMYAKQAKNFELEKQAVEIRKRAERRMGQLLMNLKEEEKLKTGRPKKTVLAPDRFEKTVLDPDHFKLSDHGITKNQSADWQKLAKHTDTDFEKALKKALSGIRPATLDIEKKKRKLPTIIPTLEIQVKMSELERYIEKWIKETDELTLAQKTAIAAQANRLARSIQTLATRMSSKKLRVVK